MHVLSRAGKVGSPARMPLWQPLQALDAPPLLPCLPSPRWLRLGPHPDQQPLQAWSGSHGVRQLLPTAAGAGPSTAGHPYHRSHRWAAASTGCMPGELASLFSYLPLQRNLRVAQLSGCCSAQKAKDPGLPRPTRTFLPCPRAGAFGVGQGTWDALQKGVQSTNGATIVPLGGDECRKRCGW